MNDDLPDRLDRLDQRLERLEDRARYGPLAPLVRSLRRLS
jgi:hypothetical protein